MYCESKVETMSRPVFWAHYPGISFKGPYFKSYSEVVGKRSDIRARILSESVVPFHLGEAIFAASLANFN